MDIFMYRLRIQGNTCSFISVDVDINGNEKEAIMKYSITLKKPGMTLPMPNDKNLTLSEALFRIDVYKKRNPSAYYFVVDEDGNEMEI